MPPKTKTTTKASANGVKPNLGITDAQKRHVDSILIPLVADETILYTKLRKYHWNVTGPHFAALHILFEDQYNQIAEVIDELAERIRQHGEKAPGTLEEFKKAARLTEQPGVYPNSVQMIADLTADHEALVRQMRADVESIDDKDDEIGTEDLLTGILQQHQKMAWFLRSHLEESE